MAKKPPLRKQLNGHPSGSVNCGPKTVQMGVNSRTDNTKNPSVDTLRKRMGRPNGQPTNVWNSEAAIDGWAIASGRKPLAYKRLHNIQSVKDVQKANADKSPGQFIQVAISYRKWNEVVSKSGSSTFVGGHSIGILGQKKWNDGTVVWLVYDPLEDARRGGIPQGPKWRPRWKVITAMEAFYGQKGKCYAGVFTGGGKK